jgi:integrase
MAKLTAATVKSKKAPGRYGDGGGLWLQVSKWRTKSWVLRYWTDGKERQLGLGPLDLVPLKDARERAMQARRLLLDNIDPIKQRREQRKARRLEKAKEMTFGKCVEAYLETHDAAWKSDKHRAQWRMTLTKYCKAISDLPVKDIDTDFVLRVLTPLWKTRTETAKRLRGRIERVLSWAKGRDLRTGENPARWDGHLDEMLAAPSKLAPVKNHPALPYSELPAFMAELRERDSISARALEFLILTAARTGEVIGAPWDEIDLDEKIWTVPAARMKAGKEHRVPLSGRALEILAMLPREKGNPHVFVGGKKGNPLSNMAMLELMRGMRPGFVPHGMRSAFRDWTSECTSYPRDVAEMALAHKIPDKVEAAYRRGDLFNKRCRLMADWSRFCATLPTTSGKVVPMQRSSRQQIG